MNRLFKLSSSVLALFLLITPIANAQDDIITKEDSITQRTVIDSELTIEKRSDGRVVPIVNADDLDDNQLNSVLRAMNYSDNLIERMPEQQKKFYASNGGVNIPVETTLKRYFMTSDGERILVTEENKFEIETLRQKEAQKLKSEKGIELEITPLASSVVDGSFSGWASLNYYGKSPNATEFEFGYGDNFSYNKSINYNYTDKLSHAWQSHTTSINAYGDYWYNLLNNTYTPGVTITNAGSVYGHVASIKLVSSLTDNSGGWLEDRVRIPVSNKGTTGRWVALYTHPWSPVIPSITIGPVSLNWSTFVGDQWEWENTFTIQAQ
jgi:hypothetical protein